MAHINLHEDRDSIFEAGMDIFQYITGQPQEVRAKDDPPGVNILFRIPGIESAHIPIYNPPIRIHDFTVEKSVRTEVLGNVTSQDSENEKKLRYRGCITFQMADGTIIHCSVSGFNGTEDVTTAIIAMAIKVKVPVHEIIKNIQQRGGSLPEEIFQVDHYLKLLLDIYTDKLS